MNIENERLFTDSSKQLRFNPKYLKFSWNLAESQERQAPDVRIMKILELTWQDPIEIGLKELLK